jgi:hypothetical protein
MLTQKEKVIDDVKKRGVDAPLNVSELILLKEIPFADLVREYECMALLVQYAKDSISQHANLKLSREIPSTVNRKVNIAENNHPIDEFRKREYYRQIWMRDILQFDKS